MLLGDELGFHTEREGRYSCARRERARREIVKRSSISNSVLKNLKINFKKKN
jgi:hypothetical protein